MFPSFSENIHLYSLHVIKQMQGLSKLSEPQKEIKFNVKSLAVCLHSDCAILLSSL